jgi:hypothetical protein
MANDLTPFYLSPWELVEYSPSDLMNIAIQHAEATWKMDSSDKFFDHVENMRERYEREVERSWFWSLHALELIGGLFSTGVITLDLHAGTPEERTQEARNMLLAVAAAVRAGLITAAVTSETLPHIPTDEMVKSVDGLVSPVAVFVENIQLSGGAR